MELIFLAILGIFAVVFFKETTTYKIASFDTSGGPATFPQYILILLLVAIAILMIQKIVKKDFKGFVFIELFKGERGIGLLSLVAYLALLTILGFTLFYSSAFWSITSTASIIRNLWEVSSKSPSAQGSRSFSPSSSNTSSWVSCT